MLRSQSPLLRWGAPLILFVLAGYAGLSTFMTAKVDMLDHRVKRRSERAVELADAHKDIIGKMSLTDYEIRPITRPVTEKEVR